MRKRRKQTVHERIKVQLRRAWFYSSERYQVVKAAKVGLKYRCTYCKKVFVRKKVVVDHVIPVIDPKLGFVDWNTFIEKLFCSVDNLQVLCRFCHKIKTNKENKARIKYGTGISKTWAKTRKKIVAFKLDSRIKIEYNSIREAAESLSIPDANISRVCKGEREFAGGYKFEFLNETERTKAIKTKSYKEKKKELKAKNKRRRLGLTYKNKTQYLTEWGKELGLCPYVISTRLRRGWSVAQALGFEKRIKTRRENDQRRRAKRDKNKAGA